MSTLYIRNGKVWINFSQNGKQIRRSLKLNAVNGKIPLEAKRIQKQIDDQLALEPYGLSPILPTIKKVTLEQFKNELYAYSKSRKSQETSNLDLYRLNTLIEHFSKDYLIQNIDVKSADKFISTLIPGRSPYTVNSHIRTYRAMFNVALKWKYITQNPFKEVAKLPVEDPIPRVLKPEEIRTLLHLVKTQFRQIEDYFYFYMLTGCRMSEALKLEWHNVDFNNNLITIEKTKNHRGRVILMSSKVREILLRRKIRVRPFPEYFGREDTLSKTFTRLFRAASLGRASLKSLRSNFASYLASVGLPQSFNEKILGHTELVSKRHYLNFVETIVQDKLQQVENILTEGQEKQQHKNSTI